MKQAHFAFLVLILLSIQHTSADKPHHIIINGNFDDWQDVKKYQDPDDNQAGTVLQAHVPDCHGTNSDLPCDIPPHVYNPIVNILEYAITHDTHNLYAYFKGKGDLSLTSSGPTDADAGRSYLQVAVDFDNYIPTGYCLNEGGYYPTSCGYDMHFELEMYNGSFNTAHYLLHAMQDDIDYYEAKQQQINGIVTFANATYKPYTEWVYYDTLHPMSADEAERCAALPDNAGPYTLPNGDQICFVSDKTNGPFQGVMQYAFSLDKRELEFSAPFIGFMNFADGTPVIQIGDTITIVMALETSGQYSNPVGEWCSDGTWPIRGYFLEPETYC